MSNKNISMADPVELDELKKALSECEHQEMLEPVKMRDILIGENVLEELPAVIRRHAGGGRVLMVMDTTYMLRRGGDLKAEISSMLSGAFELGVVTLDSSEGLHADDIASAVIEEAIRRGTDCVVGVGSGTITDLCKNAVHETDPDLPLVIVQTALSVNAFSDGVAVMIKQGVKRTVPAKYPTSLIIDLDVIKDAPEKMNVAGYGDLCATWTAPADWLLAHTLGMNPKYHSAPGELLTEQCRQLLGRSADIKNKDPQALMLLARVLTLSGLSMGIAGESTPCSGSEHLVSHLIDMSAEVRGKSLCYHGAQVSLGSVLFCVAWDRFLREFDPAKVDVDACYPKEEEMHRRVRDAFFWLDNSGEAAEECWRDFAKKLSGWKAARPAFEEFLKNWDAFKAQACALVVKPEYLCSCMAAAGAPLHFSELEPPVDRDTACWAANSSCLMRNRFVLTDLLLFLGLWDREFVDSLFRRAAELGSGY